MTAARHARVGDRVWLPTPLRDNPDSITPHVREQALALEAQITAEPGEVVSVDETGWAMVDRGSWGQFGYPLEALRLDVPESAGEPAPGVSDAPVREDFIDFPTGWRIQNEGVEHVDPKCSAAQTNGAFLCDCGAIETEWKRRVAEQRLARGKAPILREEQ